MRICDDRYSRDRLRYDLAVRFMRHEARTHIIRDWTGLTDDRIRKLHREYLADLSHPSPRRRGKSPGASGLFIRSVRMRHETTVLASLLCLFGLLPVPSQPSVERGTLACEAYEAYRTLIAEPQLSFEHALLLLAVLSRADELRLGHCAHCRGLLVLDRLSLPNARCAPCQSPEPPGHPMI